MKTFIEDLRNELNKQGLSAIEIEDIIHDHEEMIETAVKEGLSEAAILKRLGNPKAIAEEIASFSNTQSESSCVDEKQKLFKQFTVTSSRLSVEISLVYDDMKVEMHDSNQIELYCDNWDQLNRYDCRFDEKSLVIKAPKEFLSIFHRSSNNSKTFLLRLPKTIQLDQFKYSTVSGDLFYQANDVEMIHLSTTSGDLKIKNCRINNAKWNTVSGDMTISDVVIGKLHSSQVSGDMTMKNSKVEEDCILNTVSGDIHLTDCTCNECRFQSVSGDIVGTDFYPKKVALKSVNGDIVIRNKEKKAFEIISKNTISGDIHIEA